MPHPFLNSLSFHSRHHSPCLLLPLVSHTSISFRGHQRIIFGMIFYDMSISYFCKNFSVAESLISSSSSSMFFSLSLQSWSIVPSFFFCCSAFFFPLSFLDAHQSMMKQKAKERFSDLCSGTNVLSYFLPEWCHHPIGPSVISEKFEEKRKVMQIQAFITTVEQHS